MRANRSQLELLGYSHDEYVGRHVSDFHVDQTVIKDILGRLDKGEVIHNEPASLKCKDGALKEVLLSCNVHRENGKIVHSSCFTLDVTERNRAERALRESDSNLRLALESGRMGSWEWQVGTDTVTWTSGLETIYGYAPGTFPGTFEAYQSRIHPDDRLEVKETIARALTTGCDYWTEHRIKLEDGTVRWVSGRGMVIKNDQGEPVRMIGVATDITDRKKAEQDSRFLSEASVSLAGLVDYKSTLETVAKLSVPRFADWCTVDMLEEDGSIKRLVVVHTDPSQVEMIRELQERYSATERSERVVETVIRSGKPVMVEEVSDDMITAELTDPDLINIIRGLGLRSYIVVPLAIQGRVLGAMSFVTAESGRRYDMEDLKFVEDLAQRAATAIENARLYHEARQADSRKDEFLATLAHELRNPLASMTLAMEVLRIKEIGQDRLDEARSIIDRQLLHLVRLVDDLLDLSRITRDRLELRKTRVDLREVIQQAVEIAKPLAESKNHHLRVEVPDSPITVEADPTRLAQVFSNLLNNASKFTPVGGHVSLTVGCTAETVRLVVRDDGIGLTQEALPRIFDMFTQVDGTLEQTHGGLGIGLTLARRLVELHGGTISATSAGPGKGSEFTVELPLCLEHKSENTGEDVMTIEEKPLRKGLRVLVVDDNADSASMLSAMLEIEGHEAHVRYDGLAAVQAAETLEPDVVFMDIGLPGLNGFEAAERIRTNPANSGMTLVAITGWGQDQDRQRSKDAGFNVHLVKPVPIKSLKELLADISPRDRG